jgi:hypothetical protein
MIAATLAALQIQGGNRSMVTDKIKPAQPVGCAG